MGYQLAGSDWVDLMVREMTSAADVADARSRTARVLKAFEEVVQQQGAEKAATILGGLRKVSARTKPVPGVLSTGAYKGRELK